MDFSGYDEISLHSADGEAPHRYRVAFPQQEATLLQESRGRERISLLWPEDWSRISTNPVSAVAPGR